MRQFLTLIALLFFLLPDGMAQTVYKDYEDGKIFVKLKSYYNPKTRRAFLPGFRVDANNLPFTTKPDSRFGIKKLERAFKHQANEKLNTVMLLEFSNIDLVDDLIASLKYDPFVEYAEKIPIYKPFLTPNDPEMPIQWHLNKIQAQSAWNYFSSGSKIVIAVIDDAFERSHPDLAPNLWVNPGEIASNSIDDDNNGLIDDINGWDFASNLSNVDPPNDQFDHGTHVAGIASAATNNGIGVASIGFSCKIMCLKSSTSANGISTLAAREALIYAANKGANVVNMSYGGTGSSVTDQNTYDFVVSKGCIPVAAAGNDGTAVMQYPAAYNGVISVASSNPNDTKSSFSSYGSWVDITAPGSNIYSTMVGGTYENKSGTSMASPMVAGLLGLMKSLNPNMPNADLIQCLYNSADDISTANPALSGQLGAGRINAQKAMECVAGSLNRAPIADFSGSPTSLIKGGQVVFTDQSGYGPTSWQWSFPGGTPATFNGKTPPSIAYNTTGQYNVTLTVTNAFGTHAVTKTNYITVTEPPTCLTVNLPWPQDWTIVNYEGGDNGEGFVNGTNIYGDKQKAMYFNLFGTKDTMLTSVAVFFGAASTTTPSKVITFRVFSVASAALGGRPATQLGSASVPMSDIMDDVANDRATVVDFAQAIRIPTNGDFFVSVDYSTLQYDGAGLLDSLAIYSNMLGETITTPIWSMGSDNVWAHYGGGDTWDLVNASLLIHPLLTGKPAKSVVAPKTTSICSGSQISLNATGSTYGDILQWQLPGASPQQVINNQLIINPLYNDAGTFKAYLLTRGGCNEIRVDSAVITVNPSPNVAVTASKNPICAGESATLTASGAASYVWAPATGLNATTGTSVIASPTQRTSYNVTGTLGTCTAKIDYDLEVNATTTNVSLTASETSISVPTSVTFTAAPVNGGNSPTYRFYKNDVSQQFGPSSVYTAMVSPGDQVKCEFTTSEPCVSEKTVLSNIITLTNPLPVTLLQFLGVKTVNGNALSWVTSSESNTSHFVIERSLNQQTYSSLAEVAAAGNSNSNRFYNYLDGKPIPGKNYYRLKMVDKDGSSKYSPVVLIENDGNISLITLHPNPTGKGQKGILSINGGLPGKAFITISNMAGQTLQSFAIDNTSGSMQIKLSGEKFGSGIYIISYRNSKGEVVENIRWSVIN